MNEARCTSGSHLSMNTPPLPQTQSGMLGPSALVTKEHPQPSFFYNPPPSYFSSMSPFTSTRLQMQSSVPMQAFVPPQHYFQPHFMPPISPQHVLSVSPSPSSSQRPVFLAAPSCFPSIPSASMPLSPLPQLSSPLSLPSPPPLSLPPAVSIPPPITSDGEAHSQPRQFTSVSVKYLFIYYFFVFVLFCFVLFFDF